MLKPGAAGAQLQRWYERLAPLAANARAQLGQMVAERVRQASGCTLDGPDAWAVTYLWSRYTIRPSDWSIHQSDTGETPTEFTQALLLTYLVTADGTPPSGRWIGYRDLPNGMFYAQAFRGYAENRLVRELGPNGLDRFHARAQQLGGTSLEIGDAGYAFAALPRVRLAAVYWMGDEDFASRTSILFEDTCTHYLPTDGMAVLGSHLVNSLLEERES
jgi:hypothetical protein